MKKNIGILFTALILLTVTLPINSYAEENITQEFSQYKATTDSQDIKELNFFHFSGFEGFLGWGIPAEHSFNASTNRLIFKDSVGAINPGTHNFSEVSLAGYLINSSNNGQAISSPILTLDRIPLGTGSVYSGPLGYNVTFDTIIPNYEDYTYFTINISYSDRLWNQTRTATANFTIPK